ncbi:MAG: sigmaB regulation protein RsbU [Bdellovibrio sp.]|nr:MAG: sigmaB regulation protein RsbU [Bdellovibrio sp.]
MSDEHLKRIQELEAEVAQREQDLKLYREELEKANQKLEGLLEKIQRELDVAKRLHHYLVPTELPHIPGFEISTKFVPSYVQGGDCFDLFEHEDKARFGLLLTSASGHTMSALLLTVILKLTGQMEARKGAPPDQVLGTLIQEVLPQIPQGDEADLFYGVCDRRHFEFSYCLVGNIYAYYLPSSPDQKEPVQTLSSCTGPLRGSFDHNMKSFQLSLHPRDRLVFCTRGIVEALSPQGEPFGEERLLGLLNENKQNVHDLRQEIFYQVQKFSQIKEPRRDQTVVVLEVKDRIIKLAKNTLKK